MSPIQDQIMKVEKMPLFKVFLNRIGIKSYSEYMDLFGSDREKRQTTAQRFVETYKLTIQDILSFRE